MDIYCFSVVRYIAMRYWSTNKKLVYNGERQIIVSRTYYYYEPVSPAHPS